MIMKEFDYEWIELWNWVWVLLSLSESSYEIEYGWIEIIIHFFLNLDNRQQVM